MGGKTRVTVTFGRQEKNQQTKGGEEHARSDDVNDVEQGLPLDDEEEDHFLVLQVIFGVLSVDHLLGRSVFDHPLAVFCQHSVTLTSGL